ncbi:unnamed protein product, partial [Ectocarpus sp. 12 AP-2014]
MRVRVNDQTPRSFWSPRKQQARPSATISSRVPLVRALHLTWALPMETLLRKAAVELWTLSESLELQRWQCVALGSVVIGMTEPVLNPDFDMPMYNVSFPVHLRHLVLGIGFNQPIAGVVWPTSLQQLSFGQDFNSPIAGVVWPSSLQHLSF